MAKIFISYRRDDAADSAERIYDRLVAAFSKDDVFMDVDAIPIGVRFPDYLKDVVQQIDLLLVVIGKQWLNITSPMGQRRLDDPTDFVRLEIEAGLQRGIPVIPVLVQGVLVPLAPDLPESLRTLVDHQAISVRRNPDFDRDVSHLLEAIKAILATRAALVEAAARRQAEEAERARSAAAAEEQLRRRAERAQARAKVTRSVSRLLTKPVGLAILLATVLLVVALVVVSPLGNSIAFLHQWGSSPTKTTRASSPTFATAATQTAAALQGLVIGQTATIQAFNTKPYVASRPGPCGTDSSWWRASYNQPAQVTCTSNGILFTGPTGVTFFGPENGVFPADFTCSVEVVSWSGRAGPNLYRSGAPQSYADAMGLGFNPNSWYVINDTIAPLQASGQFEASSQYTMAFTVQYGYETFSINGKQIAKVQLKSNEVRTTGIGFGQGTETPADATAEFQNFTFSPLP